MILYIIIIVLLLITILQLNTPSQQKIVMPVVKVPVVKMPVVKVPVVKMPVVKVPVVKVPVVKMPVIKKPVIKKPIKLPKKKNERFECIPYEEFVSDTICNNYIENYENEPIYNNYIENFEDKIIYVSNDMTIKSNILLNNNVTFINTTNSMCTIKLEEDIITTNTNIKINLGNKLTFDGNNCLITFNLSNNTSYNGLFNLTDNDTNDVIIKNLKLEGNKKLFITPNNGALCNKSSSITGLGNGLIIKSCHVYNINFQVGATCNGALLGGNNTGNVLIKKCTLYGIKCDFKSSAGALDYNGLVMGGNNTSDKIIIHNTQVLNATLGNKTLTDPKIIPMNSNNIQGGRSRSSFNGGILGGNNTGNILIFSCYVICQFLGTNFSGGIVGSNNDYETNNMVIINCLSYVIHKSNYENNLAGIIGIGFEDDYKDFSNYYVLNCVSNINTTDIKDDSKLVLYNNQITNTQTNKTNFIFNYKFKYDSILASKINNTLLNESSYIQKYINIYYSEGYVINESDSSSNIWNRKTTPYTLN